ncbi:MAG: PTS sugar transporter subunit IIA [Spirochaetota bacterium]
MDKEFEDYKDVLCCVNSTDKYEAIEEIIQKCPVFSDIDDIHKFTQAVLRRERVETTGIGRGVAIAHGKLASIEHVHVGLGLSRYGVDFGASDGKLVHLLFVIGSSPFSQVDYLRALAAIMRFVKDAEVRKELLNHMSLDFSDEQVESCRLFLQMMASQHFSLLNEKLGRS